MRDRGVMARLVEDGNIENVYRMQITNATELTRSYQIDVTGLKGIAILNRATVTVRATSEQLVPISVQLPDGSVKPGMHAIQFKVSEIGGNERILEHSIFYMPNH